MFSLLTDDLRHVLEHSRSDFAALDGAHLFITGGTGFFGMWLLETLLFAREQMGLSLEVTLLTRNVQAFQKKAPHLARHSALKYLQGDIMDFPFPKRASYSHCIHMAAPTLAASQVGAEGYFPILDVFYRGSKRMLEFVSDASIPRLLWVSSGAAYGSQPEHHTHLRETDPTWLDLSHFQSGLGEGKRLSEYLALTAGQAYRFSVVIARCFSFVGPYLPWTGYAIASFLKDTLCGRPIVIRNRGSEVRSYLYASDLAIALWGLLVRGRAQETYNVGSEIRQTLLEVATLLAQSQQPQLEVTCLGQQTIHSIRPLYVPSTAKIQKELNISQHLMLPQALSRTLQLYRQHNGSLGID